MKDVIRQGDLPHGTMLLGGGPKTVSKAGCLLCCLVMAARECVPAFGNFTVKSAIERLRLVEAFGRDLTGRQTSAMIVPAAAAALGMRLVHRAPSLTEVEKHLDEMKPVIIGIDYKQGRSSGFSNADHFVLGVRMRDEILTVADPATGRILLLDHRAPAYDGLPAVLSEAMFLEAAA